MNDAYLLLTPLLMLPIVALLGFVGCDKVIGLQPVAPRGFPPTNLIATAGDGRVDLTWDDYTGASEFSLYRGESSGVHTDKFLLNAPATAYPDTSVTNSHTYYYAISARTAGGDTDVSDEAMATPMATTVDFVTSYTVGTPGNTFNGWAGMEFTVASQSLDVHALGRVFAAGDVHQHTIKIIEKATLTDVTSVILDTMGGTDGQMQIAPVTNPVTLSPNTTYYLVSQETAGVDPFFLDDSAVQTTGVATVKNAISGDGVTFLQGTPGYHCFGPLTFKYSVTP